MSATFWILCALLLVLALAWVLPPLLRSPPRSEGAVQSRHALAVLREQRRQLDAEHAAGELGAAEHAAALEALQARLLAEQAEAGAPADAPGTEAAEALAPAAARRVAAAVALLLPVGALALYAALGTPAALQPNDGADAAHAEGAASVSAMVDRLAERLKGRPDDAEGWSMLARSYAALERLPEAVTAYEHALRLAPADPGLLSDLADVLATVNEGRLEGRPQELIEAALRADPRHAKALALAGTAAFKRQDFAGAVRHWQQLKEALPPDSEDARRVDENLAEARAAGGLPPADASRPDAAGASDGALEGEVQVAQALSDRVQAGDTLFVYARRVQGERRPLAVLRLAASPGPLRFRLDDRQAMGPGDRLSAQKAVTLVARVSRSGQATPRQGDLIGELGPVVPGQRGLRLRIDRIEP